MTKLLPDWITRLNLMQFISKLITVIFVLNFTRSNAVWELIYGELVSKFFDIDSTFWYWFHRNFLSILEKWHILRISCFGSTRNFRRSFSSRFREFLELDVLFHFLMTECDKAKFLVRLHLINFRKFLENVSKTRQPLRSQLNCQVFWCYGSAKPQSK